MSNHKISVINDIGQIHHEAYQDIINDYITCASRTPNVKSVYQMGSLNNPGISDLDLVVVVENCLDPLNYSNSQ